MWSKKGTVGLVAVALVLVATGCSGAAVGGSGPAASSTRSETSLVPGGSPTATGVTPATGATPSTPATSRTAGVFDTTSPLRTARSAVDPEAWKVQVIVRVSVPAAGGEADGRSGGGCLSADGRYVMFTSQADNLVPGDTNLVTVSGTEDTENPGHTEPPHTYNASDVFVLDRQTGSLELVSVAGDGSQGNNDSDGAGISADGRYVLLRSEADNLVPGDTNKAGDIFVHDRQTGATDRVSVATDGSQADAHSWARGISADGRYVTFGSAADNLVPGDTNGAADVFVRDRQAGTTERVSLSTTGQQVGQDCLVSAMSSDGRFVVFQSGSPDLVPGDTNKADDIFVRDRQKGTTERVSVSSAGRQGNGSSYDGSISADGRYVCFDSDASNLVPGDTSGLRRDVFVYDRQTNTTKRVSVGMGGKEANNSSGSPGISADGRYMVFRSYAGNLVPGDTNRKDDFFVRDLKANVTWRVDLGARGEQQNTEGLGATMSADGRWVAFVTRASNLVPGDTNEMEDVFVVKAQR